jgi:prefoldin subunit 5
LKNTKIHDIIQRKKENKMNKTVTLIFGLTMFSMGCSRLTSVTVDTNTDRVLDLESRMTLNEELDTLQSDLIALLSGRVSALESLTSSLQDSIDDLQDLLDAESDARASGDEALANDLAVLAASTQTSVDDLQAQIDALQASLDDLEDAVASLGSASVVSISEHSSTSCSQISGTSSYFKVTSNKPTLYSSSNCSNNSKITELSEQSPIHWLSDTKLATFSAPKSMKVVTFE